MCLVLIISSKLASHLLLIGTSVILGINSDVGSIGTAVNKFGDRLYERLAKQRGNIVFSPFSAHSALALLTLGTDGKTQKQFLSNLFFNSMDDLTTSYLKYTEFHRNRSDGNFLEANHIFLSKRAALKDEFRIGAMNVFGAPPQVADFGRPRALASIINKWVASKTNGTITTIVDEKSLHMQTVLVLINALYFKGEWKMKFDKSNTQENSVFHSSKGEVRCDMMVMKRKRFQHLQERSFGLLEMPLSNSNIKVAFVTPLYRRNFTLKQIEGFLTSEQLFKKIKTLTTEPVDIKLPKLKLAGEYLLTKDLTAIGMSDITGKPNLSKLFSKVLSNVEVDVNHKTVVEINEDGVTAAASTAVVAPSRSVVLQSFNFDRPFLMYIYDKEAEIMFIRGRIENPGHRKRRDLRSELGREKSETEFSCF